MADRPIPSLWSSGLGADELAALQAALNGDNQILKRIRKLMMSDIKASVAKMRTPEVSESHALLVRELGIQQGIKKQVDMINQIIGE
jgi:hypothetical protein